jgi:TPR repeat protein
MLNEVTTPPDLDASQRSYERAADAGSADAMYRLGELHAHSALPNLDAARHWYDRAADAGVSAAMYSLGVVYLQSMDEPDLSAARPMFERAAEAGHRGAMYWLGMVWAHYTEPPDLEFALYWFGRAAEAGHSGAMTALGNLYAQTMQPPDLAAARHWYQRASAAGERGAMLHLEVLYGDAAAPPPGWYARPPSDDQIDAMVEWLDGPGIGVEDVFEASGAELDEVNEAFKRGDEAAVRGACDRITRLIIEELPAALPTPDPDLTRALQALIDDGNELRWAEGELADPPTPHQREALQSRFGDLMSSLHAVASIFEHDCDILDSSGRA